MSVSHSVHMGWACVAAGHAWQGVCVAGGHLWQGGCAWWGSMCGRGTCVAGGGHVWQGGMHGRGHVWQGMAGETATTADGTHPTGMHYCGL